MAKGDLGILPPNANDLINQATNANLQTAISQSYLNNVNQVTPWGSMTWSSTPTGGSTTGTNPTDSNPRTGNPSSSSTTSGTNGVNVPAGIPQWTQTMTLSPQQQALFNAQQGTQLNLANTASSHANMLGGLLSQPLSGPSYTPYGSGGQQSGTMASTYGGGGQNGMPAQGWNGQGTVNDSISGGASPYGIPTGGGGYPTKGPGASSSQGFNAGTMGPDVGNGRPDPRNVPQWGGNPHATGGNDGLHPYYNPRAGGGNDGLQPYNNPRAQGGNDGFYSQGNPPPMVDGGPGGSYHPPTGQPNPGQPGGQPSGAPGYTGFGGAPQLNTQGGGQGNIQSTIANAGNIQQDIQGAGNIQRNLGPNDYGQNVQQVQDALFSRLNPQLERQRAQLETSLANQGIRVGSDAYRKAMDDYNRGVSDQRTSIALQAGQEQNRLQDLELGRGNFVNQAQQQQYNQNANNAGFHNQAQQQQYGQNANNAAFANSAEGQRFAQTLQNAGFSNQAIQQMFQNGINVNSLNNDLASTIFGNNLAVRNQGLNEQSALMNGTQVGQPNFPGTGQGTGVAGVDTAGIQTNHYNQMQNLWGGLLGGIGNLAGGIWSDRRLKREIRQVGTWPNGLPIYTYTFEGDPEVHIGFMADEVREIRPDAVVTDPKTGYDKVNYEKAMR